VTRLTATLDHAAGTPPRDADARLRGAEARAGPLAVIAGMRLP
jgi:hypothetical protein